MIYFRRNVVCGIYFIGWSTYGSHGMNAVEMLTCKRPGRKKMGHRCFHKRRRRGTVTILQRDKVSQRGEQPAQGHITVTWKNHVHSHSSQMPSLVLFSGFNCPFPSHKIRSPASQTDLPLRKEKSAMLPWSKEH